MIKASKSRLKRKRQENQHRGQFNRATNSYNTFSSSECMFDDTADGPPSQNYPTFQVKPRAPFTKGRCSHLDCTFRIVEALVERLDISEDTLPVRLAHRYHVFHVQKGVNICFFLSHFESQGEVVPPFFRCQ